jgi:hypothetical protein
VSQGRSHAYNGHGFQAVDLRHFIQVTLPGKDALLTLQCIFLYVNTEISEHMAMFCITSRDPILSCHEKGTMPNRVLLGGNDEEVNQVFVHR